MVLYSIPRCLPCTKVCLSALRTELGTGTFSWPQRDSSLSSILIAKMRKVQATPAALPAAHPRQRTYYPQHLLPTPLLHNALTP
jgi:hypothetical protein